MVVLVEMQGDLCLVVAACSVLAALKLCQGARRGWVRIPVITTDHAVITTDHPVITTDHLMITADHPVITTDHPMITTDHAVITPVTQ